MATPTISEYTAHLRLDKAGMRDHLLSANIETKESDTFTDLSKKVLEAGNAIRQIYVQPEEPAAKHGLWFKSDAITDFDVVSDPVPFISGSLLEFNKGSDPDSAYTKGKETRFVRANNVLYYLVMETVRTYNPNEIFRIYKYEPISNTFSRIQTYNATEVSSVRGDGGYYEFRTFYSNCAACIDDNGDYLYIVGGGDADADSQKYITRFGLTTHSAERVHTKQSEWYAISGANLATAQIVDNKLYVFGISTDANAYGGIYNTRIIDLTNNTETHLNYGPIAYRGVTIKVNSHLIAGFGGGDRSYNSGHSMTSVYLFDTLTNTTTRIAELTNETNTRALAVVGGLIYFAEYNSTNYVSNSVGYINLSDNSVTYIDDVFTPKIQSLANTPALYIPSMNAIMFGTATTQNYAYTLKTKPYNKNTVILFQSAGIAAQCSVNLFTTNNFVTDVNFDLSDAWLYKIDSGLDTTGEVYYGNGTEWLPLVHGNTTGGVSALQLQHKTVTITDKDMHVTPDPGFEGLSYVDLHYTGELQEDLTEELANYDTSLTTQEVTIQDIIETLKEKAVNTSSELVIEKDINFFDYDGTLLHSYTLDEIQSLNSLPALPEHEGLICQGWNWDLEEIKEVNQELDIGPMYITDDGKTRLYIEIDKPAGFTLTIYFKQSIANGVTIDWGDGSDLYTPTTTGNQNKSHTYSTGNYVLTFDVNDNCEFKFGNDNATGISILGSNSNYDKPAGIIKKVQLGKNVFLNDYAFFKSYGIKSITIPNTMVSVNNSCLAYVYPLKFLVLPKNNTLTITDNYTLSNLENLELISLPKNYTWDNVGMSSNEAMKRTPYINDTVGSISDSAFQTCFEIEKIVMPNVTTVGNNLYSYTYNLKILDFTRCTSVPQFSGSLAYNNRMSYTFKILVPSALYDEWITASGWSTYKDYIEAV